MRWLLVDNRSFANIIFWLTLEAIGINGFKLHKSSAILIGFDEKESGLTRSIILPMLTVGIMQLTIFLVLNALSTYNTILGRP